MPVSDMDRIQPLYDAIQIYRHEYDSGGSDYSVTGLLRPPRVLFLNKRHLDKVDLFVEELFAAYDGTAAHAYWQYCLEKIPNTPYVCEERLRTTISNRSVSGAYDCCYKQRDLQDMKCMSVRKALWGLPIREWTLQQNMYRYMYYLTHGIKLRSLKILARYRDWYKWDKQRGGPKYPAYPSVTYSLGLMPFDKVKAFMTEQVNLLIKNENVPDDALPECTYEDMWSKPDQVAVKSTRVKRALRVLPSMAAAKEYVSNYLKNATCKDKVTSLSYEVRPAMRTRCDSWCPINKYCNQYHDYLKGKANGNSGN
jgi:hypothetical protein